MSHPSDVSLFRSCSNDSLAELDISLHLDNVPTVVAPPSAPFIASVLAPVAAPAPTTVAATTSTPAKSYLVPHTGTTAAAAATTRFPVGDSENTTPTAASGKSSSHRKRGRHAAASAAAVRKGSAAALHLDVPAGVLGDATRVNVVASAAVAVSASKPLLRVAEDSVPTPIRLGDAILSPQPTAACAGSPLARQPTSTACGRCAGSQGVSQVGAACGHDYSPLT